MFPVKSHLPLITTRIEFQLRELPPPPQITPRRDLGAQLRRRQARQTSVPYSRPRHTSEDLRAMSPLSSLPDSADEENREENRDTQIPKPKGDAGRVNSGGYNLKKELGWEENRYSEFTVSFIITN